MPTIYVSQGMKQYVGGTINEIVGKDISAATFTMALGVSDIVPPVAGWVAPDVATVGGTPATRVLKMLVTNTTALGTWYSWARIGDSPEILPVMLQGPFTTA